MLAAHIVFLSEVLGAAKRLLAAREKQMQTDNEFADLERAVGLASRNEDLKRVQEFTVDHGDLVRFVVPRAGTPYEHRCTLRAFQETAQAAGEMDGPFKTLDVKLKTGLSWTQTNVAIGFMRERGCIVDAHKRRLVGASGFVFEDAMIEYMSLKHAADTGDRV